MEVTTKKCLNLFYIRKNFITMAKIDEKNNSELKEDAKIKNKKLKQQLLIFINMTQSREIQSSNGNLSLSL